MLSSWIRTIIQGLSKGVQNVPLLTKQGSNSIVLARPCILWLLIIPPASPLALGPIGPPSLFNCLKFPRGPSSLCPSPSLLSHTNAHSPFRSHPLRNPLLPPQQAGKTRLEAAGGSLHTGVRLSPAGDDTPGKPPFSSPRPDCTRAGLCWLSLETHAWWAGRQCVCISQPVRRKQGTHDDERPKEVPLRIRWPPLPSQAVLLVAKYLHGDLGCIYPVQFFSCSIRSCMLYLWHMAFFPPNTSLSPPLQHMEPLLSPVSPLFFPSYEPSQVGHGWY